MRVDPKNLGNKEKTIQLLEAIRDKFRGKEIDFPNIPFDAIEQSNGEWDVFIRKERFLIKLEKSKDNIDRIDRAVAIVKDFEAMVKRQKEVDNMEEERIPIEVENGR